MIIVNQSNHQYWESRGKAAISFMEFSGCNIEIRVNIEDFKYGSNIALRLVEADNFQEKVRIIRR